MKKVYEGKTKDVYSLDNGNVLLKFKDEGMTCIIISHKLNEVSYVADEITVIRDGTTIETIDNAGHDIDEDRIIKGMVGREIEDRFPKRPDVKVGDISMEVTDWTVFHPLYPDKKVVDNVNIHVRKGEVVVMIGPSGGGKSTFLRCMNLLEQPTEGSIIFDGIDIVSADERTKNRVRSEMGMVFQHFNLFPHLTILDNITLAPKLVRGISAAEAGKNTEVCIIGCSGDCCVCA